MIDRKFLRELRNIHKDATGVELGWKELTELGFMLVGFIQIILNKKFENKKAVETFDEDLGSFSKYEYTKDLPEIQY